MTSMVERVARAICESQTQGTGFWKAFVPEARAAIAAMREPTEGMIEAAEREDGGDPYAEFDSRATGTVHWQAMIDAALEEKP